MKHPLVPSIEILGALELCNLNDQSIYGVSSESVDAVGTDDCVSAQLYDKTPPGQVLYVDRLPRRRNTPDCRIGVGYIAAWHTHWGDPRGILFEDLADTLEFARLAKKGFHTARLSLFRAASIVKWNSTTGLDERSIVVDAEALEWRPGAIIEWTAPLEICDIKHSH